jgi:hypothetical protein
MNWAGRKVANLRQSLKCSRKELPVIATIIRTLSRKASVHLAADKSAEAQQASEFLKQLAAAGF